MRKVIFARVRAATLVALMSMLVGAAPCTAANAPGREWDLRFDPARGTLDSALVGGITVRYHAYPGIVYVRHPVDTTIQCLNLFVPAAYAEGRSVGDFSARTAPIFLPNSVGGYLPGYPGRPGAGFDGKPNAALVALSRGLVVAAPGARGRTSRDATGRYTGKAPAAIVDLKAAVRWLRFNASRVPGDVEKIVSDGTSAGGALSALLGASGNSGEFAADLAALGAADARDDIFAVAAYCPIADLDHADAAYEWQFAGVNDYARMVISGPPGGGPPAGGGIQRSVVQGALTPEQVEMSALLAAQFPAYVNGLGLRRTDGDALTLDAAGNGSFKEYVRSYVVASAQAALAGGTDLSSLEWLTIRDGRVVDVDFGRYVRFATRLKPTAAFDGQDLGNPENGLFGAASVDARHFTAFGQEHSTVPATRADTATVLAMNPMHHVGAPGVTTSRFWRIRHGAIDRDISLAIPVILATRLANTGRTVDFAVPWGVGHAGDYDLDGLFDWVCSICR